jgi:VIT1/CCC1 family predicted Fe2+/Mn2+ transporter
MVNDPSLFASFVVGTLLPVLIAFILHYDAPETTKAIVAFVVCCVVAGLTMWLTDKFMGISLGLTTNEKAKLYVENAGLVLMTAWGFYARFWSKLGEGTIVTALNSSGLKVGRPTP